MSKKVLKEYLHEVLNEELRLRNLVDKMYYRKGSFLDSLKSLFRNSIEEVVSHWLESKEDQYGVLFEEDFKQDVMRFSKRVYEKALEKTRGNAEKAESLLLRTLEVKYARNLSMLEREYLKRFEEDE
jgi:hypothetical protein